MGRGSSKVPCDVVPSQASSSDKWEPRNVTCSVDGGMESSLRRNQRGYRAQTSARREACFRIALKGHASKNLDVFIVVI